ncbi:MAG: cation diffusion facilitator family transporter [Methanomicrobiaceae archaeon]|nr:cation diffusion facilitator family transporter [Methanomicrobiaceae archaeon]
MQSDTVSSKIQDRKKEDSVIRKVAVYSLFVNTFLVIAKLYLAGVSGSLSLEADAINSFIDIFVSFALLIGIWLSSLKSRNFPYGLYKIENIVSILIAFLVFLTAWEVFIQAVSEKATDLTLNGWVLSAVLLLAFVPYLLGTYEVRMGNKYKSPGLIADGRQHRVDVLSTLVVFFALFAQYLGFFLDSIGAIIVAGFIAYSGWDILKDSMKTLLDASIDYKTRDLIKSAIISDPMVICIKELNARNSGRYIFVEATVKMKKNELFRAHLASERIESKIYELVPNVERVIIHYEPTEKKGIRYAVPLKDSEGNISLHFGESPYFALLDFSLKDAKLVQKQILQNPSIGMEKQKGIRSAEFLLEYKPDAVISGKKLTGKSAEYVFESAGILVKVTDEEDIRELIKKIETDLKNNSVINEL